MNRLTGRDETDLDRALGLRRRRKARVATPASQSADNIEGRRHRWAVINDATGEILRVVDCALREAWAQAGEGEKVVGPIGRDDNDLTLAVTRAGRGWIVSKKKDGDDAA